MIFKAEYGAFNNPQTGVLYNKVLMAKAIESIHESYSPARAALKNAKDSKVISKPLPHGPG
jgi:hypothetical protein